MPLAKHTPGLYRDSKVGAEIAFDRGIDVETAVVLFEDFLGPAAGTPDGHVTTNAQTANITVALNGAAGGAVAITADATAEAQAGRVDIGPWDLGDILRVRWKQTNTPAGATYPANVKCVGGIATVIANAEDDLDAETINLWFGAFGASLNLVWESDDNATNDDDNAAYDDTATQMAYVKGTAHEYEIDFQYGLDRVRLKFDGEWVRTSAGAIVEIDMSAATAQDVYWVLDWQRSSATGAAADVVAVDWVEVVYMK